MKNILKLEQLTLFFICIYMYAHFGYSWIWFVGLFFTPDLLMLGYLFGNKVGAICYNLVHTYITSFALALIGYLYSFDNVLMVGMIFTSHIAFDRMLGYGLKKFEGFKFTHLGNL